MVSQQAAAQLQEDISALSASIEKDEDAIKTEWVTVTQQGETRRVSWNEAQVNADRYEQLWKKSTNSRKLE